MKDIFQANEWYFGHLPIIVLSLLLAFLGSMLLDILGFTIPLLRQITGFFLLTFVPGILILRILRIRNLSAVETTIYASGLSLATLVFTGFFMNIVYPLFGLLRPISLWPLVATISVLIGILCFLAWLLDRDFAAPVSINLHEILSPPVLALSLLPFGAIAGTYLMNFYDTNTLQMILLPIISLVPAVIVCTRFIPEKYYTYAVFSVAITLLYHTALISTHIWGWDIQYEYYLTNIVIQNSIWDFTDYSNCNAMLSLMALAPIYSILLGIGLEWVFKIIYPFFLALVPLGLYVIFQRQTNEKISFLACFFFMSIFVFYTEMLALARQEVAELFLVLILLSMIDRGLVRQQRLVLLLIFTASLIVSHYGLSYIFMLMLLSALTIAVLDYHIGIQDRASRILNWIHGRVGRFNELKLKKVCLNPSIMPLSLIIWYILFLLAWYIYIASSSPFTSSVTIAKRVSGSISSDLLSPEAAQGMAMIVTEAATPLHEVAKYLHLLTILFIVVGFIFTVVFRQKEINFDVRYLLLSCGALGICIGGVALPFFATALNTSRMYQISLILLAPFCIVGGIALTSGFRALSDSYNRSLHIVALFLGVFLLFNCGWVYEVCQDEPTSFALNSSLDSPVFSEQEVLGSLWLTDVKDSRSVAADRHRRLLLSGFIGRPACYDIQIPISDHADKYIFIGQHNLLHNHIVVTRMVGVLPLRQYIMMSGFREEGNAIYSNGRSQIYYPRTYLENF